MDLYEKILKDFYFNVIIWEKTDSGLICVFSNDKNTTTKYKSSLSDYLKTNNSLENSYTQLLKTNKEQNITLDNQDINIYMLDTNTFYEIRTPVKTAYDYTILSNISSQIRDPLTNMMGATSTLTESNLTKQQKQAVAIIEKSVYDVLALTNDVIDIVNLKHNKIKLNYEFSKLSTCISNTFEVIKARANSKKVTITTKIDSTVPDNVKIDTKRLMQILINILYFSIKNLDSGHIIINVTLLKNESPFETPELAKPKYNILFKIRDSAELSINTIKYLENVLGLKTYMDIKSYNNISELGIIISKYLCNLMGGNIWFKDATEFGTTYCFNIITEAKN
jgi:K+-sensing histidine kinase KdpD